MSSPVVLDGFPLVRLSNPTVAVDDTAACDCCDTIVNPDGYCCNGEVEGDISDTYSLMSVELSGVAWDEDISFCEQDNCHKFNRTYILPFDITTNPTEDPFGVNFGPCGYYLDITEYLAMGTLGDGRKYFCTDDSDPNVPLGASIYTKAWWAGSVSITQDVFGDCSIFAQVQLRVIDPPFLRFGLVFSMNSPYRTENGLPESVQVPCHPCTPFSFDDRVWPNFQTGNTSTYMGPCETEDGDNGASNRDWNLGVIEATISVQ